jgi:hypothetical protein
VSLAAVTNDGDRFALQYLGLGVAFIKNSNHRVLLSLHVIALHIFPLHIFVTQGGKEALAD